MASSWQDEEDHVKEVYAQAGLALYFAQCFEMALSNFLFLHFRATNVRVTIGDLTNLESANARKTLGSLLKSVKSLCAFDEAVVERLERALDQRNRLCHYFFKDSAESFLSRGGRETMLNTLLEYQSSMQDADAMIEAANRALASALGVTDEDIQREYARILASQSDA